MKRLIIISLALILFGSVVFAQGQQGSQDLDTGTMNPGQGQQNQDTGQEQEVQTEQAIQNQGEEDQLMIQERTQLKVQKLNEVNESVQKRQQEMNEEMEQLKEGQQKIYKNQNQVRLAVHSLLAMEDLVGKIGPQVSQIAKEFDNSVQSTIRAEEKIETRSRIVRFFVGGDQESAELMAQEVNLNRERIQELNQLMEECDCDEQIRAILQEQIQNMEQEQNRLQQLAEAEKEYKGLFGWLFGWLRK